MKKIRMKMKKTYHSTMGRSASGGKKSAFGLLPSTLLSAFTLPEVMIATMLFGLVVAGTISVYTMCNKLWHANALSMQTVHESSMALSRIVYGMETNTGLRSASMITNMNLSGGSWRMTVSNSLGGCKYIFYNGPQKILSNANSIICSDVSTSSVTINATNGIVRIQLTVQKRDGMFLASNTVATLVKMRNKQ